jgi:hypothetical protein
MKNWFSSQGLWVMAEKVDSQGLCRLTPAGSFIRN